MYVPNFCPFFMRVPPKPKYQMMKSAISKGTDDPTANILGKINPYEVEIAIGMSVTENKKKIAGQKANAMEKPNKNEPSFPLPLGSLNTGLHEFFFFIRNIPII